jgi:hypothetical protein
MKIYESPYPIFEAYSRKGKKRAEIQINTDKQLFTRLPCGPAVQRKFFFWLRQLHRKKCKEKGEKPKGLSHIALAKEYNLPEYFATWKMKRKLGVLNIDSKNHKLTKPKIILRKTGDRS